MGDKGGLELVIYFKSDSDDLTSKEPSIEVVAVPLDIDTEALYVRGGLIRLQVKRAKVNDNDLDSATFGPCAGYCTVWPGYIAKQMQPPQVNVQTFHIDWCELYRDEEDYFLSCRYTTSDLGDKDQYFWGRFG